MSGYGYPRLTTPHIDRLAGQGVLFERNYSPHVPTTSAYGDHAHRHDCFSTEVVALRHRGPLTDKVKTLAEFMGEAGYGPRVSAPAQTQLARLQNYIEYRGGGVGGASEPETGKLE